jgi:hypothetical protein
MDIISIDEVDSFVETYIDLENEWRASELEDHKFARPPGYILDEFCRKTYSKSLKRYLETTSNIKTTRVHTWIETEDADIRSLDANKKILNNKMKALKKQRVLLTSIRNTIIFRLYIAMSPQEKIIILDEMDTAMLEEWKLDERIGKLKVEKAKNKNERKERKVRYKYLINLAIHATSAIEEVTRNGGVYRNAKRQKLS